MDTKYLASVKQQMLYYKSLGDTTLNRLEEQQLFVQPNHYCNSIAMIVQHMHGNMLSRWTDFLTSDGEKEWRQRDAEFETVLTTRAEVMQKWNEGWTCLMHALDQLTEDNLIQTVFIRNEAHTAIEAINRQLAHYPYHVGQIVFYAKALQGQHFESLSIAKNQSVPFNKQKFGKA